MAPFIPRRIGIGDNDALANAGESARFQSADRLTVREARDLLDWLENHGIRAREVACDSEGLMSIRWAA